QELEKNPLLAEGSADDAPSGDEDAPVVEAPADTAEVLAAAAPALADADERWTREHADRAAMALRAAVANVTMRRTPWISLPKDRVRLLPTCCSRSSSCSRTGLTGASRSSSPRGSTRQGTAASTPQRWPRRPV